ncbi:MAG: hypothetical protein KME19_24465 [Microcoleus vaginatus WJT46-NPBG5]|nr:hypothetical protein [Microcoleus vaginatus WJT46-NPBG5]
MTAGEVAKANLGAGVAQLSWCEASGSELLVLLTLCRISVYAGLLQADAVNFRANMGKLSLS